VTDPAPAQPLVLIVDGTAGAGADSLRPTPGSATARAAAATLRPVIDHGPRPAHCLVPPLAGPRGHVAGSQIAGAYHRRERGLRSENSPQMVTRPRPPAPAMKSSETTPARSPVPADTPTGRRGPIRALGSALTGFSRPVRSPLVRVGDLVHRAPVTVSIVVALWVLGAATASVRGGPPPGLREMVGIGLAGVAAGRWWTVVSSGLWCSGPISYVITSVLLLVLVGSAERRIGSARTALLAVATQALGTGVGIALVALGARAGAGLARHRSPGLGRR